MKLLSCSSVSGGKTSAFMALHYPTDYYFFAPVLTRDRACIIQDKSLRQYCQDKVDWFDWANGGCRELDLTLSNLRKLEQELGKEIEWIAAPFTYDDLITGDIEPAIARAFGARATKSTMLPNKALRFCTEALKIYPIAWRCYLRGNGLPMITNIGFRWDEPQRIQNWKCDRTSMTLRCDIAGGRRRKHRHELVDYRLVRFPLYQDRVTKLDVIKFWHGKGWTFPTVSNCDFCFNHKDPEMLHQQLEAPDRVQWWISMENRAGASFGDRPLEQILDNPQIDLFGADLNQFSCLCGD